MLKTAEEWLEDEEFKGIIVMDADGWDRTPEGWHASWNEKITVEEMHKRIGDSTCQIPVAMMRKWANG